MKFNDLTENITVALHSVRSHRLRTTLTMMIIAFGIMALVGILTSIDAIRYYLNDNFSQMGAGTLTLRNRGGLVTGGGDRKRHPEITYLQAMEFKERYTFPANVSVNYQPTGNAQLKYQREKTLPNIGVYGSDEAYLITSGNNLSAGRNFSTQEVNNGTAVAIVGQTIVEKLFVHGEEPVDKVIKVGSTLYRIVGVLEEKGSSFGFSSNNIIIVPLNAARSQFSGTGYSYKVNIMPYDVELLDAAQGEAIGLFRVIRGRKTGQPDEFFIAKSDSLASMLFDNLKMLRLAATIIGLITLMGAAIGLMNIMLVSVTERTREIGIRKAVGARSSTIRQQFLIEAVVIAQLGGFVGIVLGVAIGNILSHYIGSVFIVPWVWMLIGVVLCFGVAVLSGIIPANKAARLDPVESLRYE